MSTQEKIGHAFINGLSYTNIIGQRLLGNRTLAMLTTFDKARALDVGQQSPSVCLQQPTFTEITALTPKLDDTHEVRFLLVNQFVLFSHSQ